MTLSDDPLAQAATVSGAGANQKSQQLAKGAPP